MAGQLSPKNVLRDAEGEDPADLAVPAPLDGEPGEAQRVPNDWPLPYSAAVGSTATANAEMAASALPSEHRCSRFCRVLWRAVAFLCLVVGAVLLLWALLRDTWPVIWQWIFEHALLLSGIALMLVGSVLWYLTGSSKDLLNEQALAWHDLPAVKDVEDASTKEKIRPRFHLRLWNDAARFGKDVEALEELASKCGRGPGPTEELLRSDPELFDLAKQAVRVNAKAQAERAASGHDALVSRCKADLRNGISLRRLRQKLEPRCFVLDFSDGIGQMPNEESDDNAVPSLAKQLVQLKNAISFLLTVCSPYDEVVLRITSPGGLVGEYGLASAQLARLRKASVRLVACVDTLAASGGYMMACVADHVVAAPFATLGSIGVVATIPNFHKILERHEVDYLQFTAGRYKRTVDMFAKNTKEGLTKFQSELEAVHTAFTAHVQEGRGSRIEGGADRSATGEVFIGSEAIERGLIDELGTSDEYLRRRAGEGFVVIELRQTVQKRTFWQKVWDCFDVGASTNGSHDLLATLRIVASAPVALFRNLWAGPELLQDPKPRIPFDGAISKQMQAAATIAAQSVTVSAGAQDRLKPELRVQHKKPPMFAAPAPHALGSAMLAESVSPITIDGSLLQGEQDCRHRRVR